MAESDGWIRYSNLYQVSRYTWLLTEFKAFVLFNLVLSFFFPHSLFSCWSFYVLSWNLSSFLFSFFSPPLSRRILPKSPPVNMHHHSGSSLLSPMFNSKCSGTVERGGVEKPNLSFSAFQLFSSQSINAHFLILGNLPIQGLSYKEPCLKIFWGLHVKFTQICVWYANRWRVSRWWEFAWQQYFNSSALHLRDCSLSDKVTSWWSYSCQAAQNNHSLEKLQILKLAFLVQNELWNKGIQGQKNSNSFVAFCLKRSEFYLAANPVRILELVTTCISKMQNTQIQST